MALPKVQPAGGTPTAREFVSLQTLWASMLDRLIQDFNSEPPLVGEVVMWGGSAIPSKFLLCDGTTVLQSQYAALFQSIRTTFNTGGEPAGSFRLPAAGSPIPFIIRYAA